MAESFDQIAMDLQDLRARAGHPSYADIVATIAKHREADGASAFAARPGRTTVYDAFRTGRRRVDPSLVGEIVRALGVDEAGAERWEERCREARRAIESPGSLTPSVTLPAPPTNGSPGDLVSTVGPVGPVEPASSMDSVASIESVASVHDRRPRGDGAVSNPPIPPAERPGAAVPRSLRRIGAVMFACIAVNLLGRALVELLDMALFLDMTGTAVAAITLGPWFGAAVGLASNLLGSAVSGPASIPFAAVNVVGALVWGYGVRSRRFTRSLPSFVGLNVLVAVVCTTTAVPITLALGDVVTHGTSRMAAMLTTLGPSLFVAIYSTNLLMSVADKLICGFVALTAMEVLPGRSLLQNMTLPSAQRSPTPTPIRSTGPARRRRSDASARASGRSGATDGQRAVP